MNSPGPDGTAKGWWWTVFGPKYGARLCPAQAPGDYHAARDLASTDKVLRRILRMRGPDLDGPRPPVDRPPDADLVPPDAMDGDVVSRRPVEGRAAPRAEPVGRARGRRAPGTLGEDSPDAGRPSGQSKLTSAQLVIYLSVSAVLKIRVARRNVDKSVT